MKCADCGSEIGGSVGRGSKVFIASFITLVLGLVAYVTGFLVYSYGWDRAYNYQFNPNISYPPIYRYIEWGQWAEGIGIILVILGITLVAFGIMRSDRKQVHP
jgi:hypothetical protein